MTNIRKARPEDLNELAILFDEYRRFYKQPSDIAAAKKFLQERLSQNESAVFIAFDDGKAAGFTQLYPIFTSVGLQRTWLLNDLYIAPSSRRKGLASLLLNAAKEFGRSTSSKWLLLETAADNYSAQALYENDGWQKAEDIFYQFNL
jgi:ribosomal protein S18 acetylase RimI-like enzyme